MLDQNRERALALTRGVLVVSFSCSFLVYLAWTLLHPETSSRTRSDMAVLLGLPSVGLLLWWLAGALYDRRKPFEWLVVIAVANALILVPEIGLRLFGFQWESGIQFGWPRPITFMSLVPDAKLFWRLPSSSPNVNSLGFPGAEPKTPKPHDVVRLVFLGDSCTEQGYPDIVADILNARQSRYPKRFESLTLAVSGYSSHQGRVMVEDLVPKLEPDLVLVYFGWNDHWLAYGQIDSKKKIKALEISRLYKLAVRSRIVQFCQFLGAAVAGTLEQPLDQVRVPLPEYRENLLAIRSNCVKIGVPTVFITAPTSHYQLGFPDRWVNRRAVRDKESGIELHKAYNATVRSVASLSGAHLLDLEQLLNKIPNLGHIFLEDGIHFTPSGLALVSVEIAEFIENTVLPPVKH